LKKKFEIKKIKALSLFKTFLFLAVIPAVILMLFGIVLMAMGVMANDDELVYEGFVGYVANTVLMTLLYGLLTIPVALVYNFLAGKFGGLKLELSESVDTKEKEEE